MIRILPSAQVGPDDAARLAWAIGFRDEGALPGTAGAPPQQSWVAADGTSLTWVDDAVLGISYAVVDGPSEDNVAARAEVQLSALAWPDIVRQLAVEDDWVELVELVYRLAIAAPRGYSAPVADVIGRLAEHPNSTVRRATYVAIRYINWPVLDRILRAAAHSDSDPEGRALAASLAPHPE